TGAALTVGGIALATYVKFAVPEKDLLHFAVMAFAIVVSVIGIGIYEDANVGDQPALAKAPPARDGFLPSSSTP
nr:hypothetical protein [Hyphomicrobium sp.]